MNNTKLTGSSPVRPLPSEWAQQLAQHIFSECGTTETTRGFYEDDTLYCTNSEYLARIIQEFYDSIP